MVLDYHDGRGTVVGILPPWDRQVGGRVLDNRCGTGLTRKFSCLGYRERGRVLGRYQGEGNGSFVSRGGTQEIRTEGRSE